MTTSYFTLYSFEEFKEVVKERQSKTNLTRKTIIDIPINSKRQEDFKRNIQKNIEETKIIRKNLRLMLVDGIRYSKFRNVDYYSIEMFNDSELLSCLNDRIVESIESPYNYAIYDSDIEYKFAIKFEEGLYFVVETKDKSDISLLKDLPITII